MKFDLHITQVSTGESRLWKFSGYDPDWEGAFVWRDGNFSCDCNRALFFAEVNGEDAEDDDGDIPCSDGLLFKVRIVERGTQNVLYED